MQVLIFCNLQINTLQFLLELSLWETSLSIVVCIFGRASTLALISSASTLALVDEYSAIAELQNESSDISKLIIMKSRIKGFFWKSTVFVEVKRMEIH